jgi:hypothetical protein
MENIEAVEVLAEKATSVNKNVLIGVAAGAVVLGAVAVFVKVRNSKKGKDEVESVDGFGV